VEFSIFVGRSKKHFRIYTYKTKQMKSKNLKHIQLFENFNGEEKLLFTIDAIKEFPSLYPEDEKPEDFEGSLEPKATISVYGLTPPYKEESQNEAYTHFDPSFYDNSNPTKIKLVFSQSDQFGYGSDNEIYAGFASMVTPELVIEWFNELLEDPSRDYLSV
jgi:hypothetical protein